MSGKQASIHSFFGNSQARPAKQGAASPSPASATPDGQRNKRKRDGSPDADDGPAAADAPARPGASGPAAAAEAPPAEGPAAARESGPTAKVDGVGQGAISAAALHRQFELEAVVSVAPWRPGDPVPYGMLAAAYTQIAQESKRLAIISMLTNTFRAIIAHTPEDLLPAAYLSVGRVAPAHSGIELGVGDAILLRALAAATGRQEAALKKDYAAAGDLGEVAVSCKKRQRTMATPAPLTIRGVFKALKEIASLEGNRSQEQKKARIMQLLASAKDQEPAFLVRCLQGRLRIGLAEQSVLVALAHAITLQGPGCESVPSGGEALAQQLERAAAAVRTAVSECPSYDALVPALLQHGTTDLQEHVHFEPGTPVKAMLAKPTTGVAEVLDKFGECEFTCEYKYDGERAQVHVLEDGSVQLYSRNLENTTKKYPEVAARVRDALAPGVKSVVLDGELQAWDREKKQFLPFQTLSTRKRKDVKAESITVQVVLYCFDCLYLDGDVVMRRPLTERREALHRAITPVDDSVQFAVAKTSRDVEALQEFLEEAVAAATEGLIVKTLADPYEPSKRSLNWLKLKKDYLDGQGDTFDVAVIGALHGRGKRSGGFGSFLLAIYDPQSEEYQSITKIGTGFSEELLKEISANLRELVIEAPRSYYQTTERVVPDVWLDAKVVWEVKAADLSLSPVYTAARGLVHPDKGISIRFPRLVRVREDKGPEDTTSPEQVAEMYSQQAVVTKGRKPAADDDFW